jgi:CBS domain containing-hemolysin-like protein
MSEDRSPVERTLPPVGDPGTARERWFERLLNRLHLRSRESIREDLEDAIAETVEDPDFSPKERAMLKNVLGLHRIRVDDVMIPRADIIAVAADTTLGELLGVFRTAGHSRLPVYGETLDDPKGMVHIRDFVDFVAACAEASMSGGPGIAGDGGPDGRPSLGDVDLSVTLATAKILRPVLFAPPSMPAIDLLVRMQATRTHIALVIDEYGGTDGLVSIEDLVEIVVGDIEDEHDDAATRMIVRGDDKTFIADGRASLEEVSETLGIDLAGDDMAEEIDTLGGLIGTLAGRVPSRGELVAGPNGLEFEVLDADPRRLKRVRIHRREAGRAGALPDEAGASDAAPPVAKRSGAGGPPA